jgi:hypothetical protein
VLLALTICSISGCSLNDEFFFGAGDANVTSDPGLTGAHYARLNSIGCFDYDDIEKIRSGDTDIIDNLIRQNRCFVIPTDKDIYIQDRVKGDILSARIKDSTQLFYTLKKNLGSK